MRPQPDIAAEEGSTAFSLEELQVRIRKDPTYFQACLLVLLQQVADRA